MADGKHWVKQVGFEVNAIDNSSRHYPKARGACVMEVIASQQLEGAGNKDDPYREVTYFFSLDGRPLARHDGWEIEQKEAIKNG